MTTFASGTDTLTRDALTVLQPGFTGTTAPDWLLRRLGEGLASVGLFGRNIASPEQLAALYRTNPRDRTFTGQLVRCRIGPKDYRIVGTHIETAQPVMLFGARGEHDDGNMTVFPQRPRHVHSIHSGKTEIENDQRGLSRFEQAQGFQPVAGGCNRIAGVFEIVAEDLCDLRLVVDEQDSGHRRN